MQSKFLYQVSTRRMTLAAAERWAERRGMRLATTKEIGILYHGGKIPDPEINYGYWTNRPWQSRMLATGGYIFIPSKGLMVASHHNELSRVVAVSI